MKSMEEKPVKSRRKFDPTFKREAVQNWLSSGESAAVVAQELGLHANRLYAWKKRFAPPDAGGRAAAGAKPGSVADLQARLDAAERENRHLREQRDILKKNVGHSLRSPDERYQRVDAMRDQYSILALCHELDVSPSGYYDWRQRQSSLGARAVENQILATQIKQLHKQSRQTCGSPRIVGELRKRGARHGRNRVARLMKQEGLCGRPKARYRVQATESHRDEPIAPNRLAEAPKASAPNQIWVADLTYIPTREGWLYLAAIMDLYSRKIVG